jgi:hypothetical protein
MVKKHIKKIIDIEEAKKIYNTHKRECVCEVCVRVEKWYKEQRK